MSPRQFPDQPADRSAGSVAVLSLFLFGAAYISPAALGGVPETISWRSDYNTAYYEAKDSKRLIWIQFTGPWCPNCRRMEHDSFPQPKIVEHAKESFIPVKLRSDENEDLALRFNLTGLPATVIIDPTNRSILSLQQGYLGPDELNALFEDAVARGDKAKKLEDARLAALKKKRTETLASHHETSDDRKAKVSKPVADDRQPSLSGFCVVSLVTTHRLVRGNKDYSCLHNGKLYRFADEKAREQFRKNPESFLPVNEGYCPVATLEGENPRPGDPRFGILYRERLFLCATREDRSLFLQNPDRYSMVRVEEKGFCPHCAQQAGRLVKGNPSFCLIRSGREYWFPDAEHRTAFLESLPADPKSVRK